MARGAARRIQGIVLDTTKLSEQDLIVTLLARSGEELRVVAKGARKPGSRLASRMELYGEVDLLVAPGRSLGIVSEASSLAAHGSLRGDLARLSCASAVAEVARLTCFADVEDAFLYPLCSRALGACEEAPDQPHLDVVYAAYVLKALAHAGWRPQLDRCVFCGDEAVTWISPATGGALCFSCAKDVGDAQEASPRELGWASALVTSTFDQLVSTPVDAASGGWLAGFAHRWAATHLEARLRAAEFYLAQ